MIIENDVAFPEVKVLLEPREEVLKEVEDGDLKGKVKLKPPYG